MVRKKYRIKTPNIHPSCSIYRRRRLRVNVFISAKPHLPCLSHRVR